MVAFAWNVATLLKEFHSNIESRARNTGASIAAMSMLKHQTDTYESTLKDFAMSIMDTINA